MLKPSVPVYDPVKAIMFQYQGNLIATDTVVADENYISLSLSIVLNSATAVHGNEEWHRKMTNVVFLLNYGAEVAHCESKLLRIQTVPVVAHFLEEAALFQTELHGTSHCYQPVLRGWLP